MPVNGAPHKDVTTRIGRAGWGIAASVLL